MICNRNSVPVIWVLTTSSKTMYAHSMLNTVWKLEGNCFPVTWYLCYFKCADPTALLTWQIQGTDLMLLCAGCGHSSNSIIPRKFFHIRIQTTNDWAFLIKSSLGLLHWFCEAMSLPVWYNIYLIVFWCCSILLYQIFSYFIKDNVYPHLLLFTSHWSMWIIIG